MLEICSWNLELSDYFNERADFNFYWAGSIATYVA